MSATAAYFVTRTVRALELLAFGPASARELAARLQVHERTARRLLGRLVDEEYVTRLDEPRRRYVLTARLVAVAGQWLEHSELPHAAAPFVARLHTRTGLPVHLVTPSYDRVLCVVHCDDAGVPAPRLRELVPAHATAGGKVLLAARERWRASLLSAPLRAYTERTVTEPSAVQREALATRERGYAIEDGEYRCGVCAAAAAVHDRSRDAIAALGVSVAGSLDYETVGDIVRRTAAELSTALAESTSPQVARTRSPSC